MLSNETDLEPGLHSLWLVYPGSRISAFFADGPYSVQLALTVDTIFTIATTYTTGPYVYSQFESSPVSFVRPHGDVGLDMNADGPFDWIVVRVGLVTDVGGFFDARASLVDSENRLQLAARNYTYLSAGVHLVDLYFPGASISSSGSDGPYFVSIAVSATYVGFTGSDSHTTASYLSSEFG